MGRWIARLLLLATSAVLLIWAYEGLTGTDQSTSMLPFLSGPHGGYGAIIMVGVAWGFLLMTPGADLFGRSPSSPSAGGLAARRMTEVAVATVIEMSPTGVTINDVPQYDLFLRVAPSGQEEFIARIRTLLGVQELEAVGPGAPLPVRYDPASKEAVALADMEDPQVRERLLRWRIDEGLIEPALVGARTRGISSPASVVSLRPTGERRHGQVQLDVDLLVTPDDGSTPWNASTRVFLYPQALSRVQVGSPVVAMYEPHAPLLVALTLEAPEVHSR